MQQKYLQNISRELMLHNLKKKSTHATIFLSLTDENLYLDKLNYLLSIGR